MDVTMPDVQSLHDVAPAGLGARDACESAGGARTAVKASTAGPAIYLVGQQHVGIVPVEEAELMVALADDLQAQSGKMSQQADRLATLVAFADRLREAMGAAASSAVRLDVQPIEEQVAVFLLTQARARAYLVDRTRYRHVCRVCGMSTLSNPEYESLVAHKRKVDAAMRGLGVAFATGGGAAPVVMANALLAFRKQRPDYHCPRCQALDTDQSVVVFCPQCKALHDKPLLKQCPKCHYDFIKAVDVSDLWQPLEAVAVPAPAGEKLDELELDDYPTAVAFLPDSQGLVTACSGSVQLWKAGGADSKPQRIWTTPAYAPLMTVSPDGQTVAIGHPKSSSLRLRRAADGVDIANVDAHSNVGWGVTSLVFRPDGGAVIASLASKVEIWSLKGRPKKTMKLGLTTVASSVTCSPDGSWIAAVGNSTTDTRHSKLYLWRATDGTHLATLTYDGSITGLAWASTTTLALANGKAIRLITIPSGNRITELALDAEACRIAVGSGGVHLAVTSGPAVFVFDLRTLSEVARISRPAQVNALAFAADGRLAVADAGGTVQFWAPPQSRQ